MAAFVPGAAPGSFVARTVPKTCRQRPSALRMGVNPEPPLYSLYLSKIPVDRLNKAPMITINTIPGAPDDSFNSVSVSLCDMARDESAGNSLKAGVDVDDSMLGSAPAPALYEKYFPKATLHEAPLISLVDGGTELTRSMTIIQCEAPTSITTAKTILGDGVAPGRETYLAYDSEVVNMAPCVEANFNTCDEDSVIQAPMTAIPLDYAGARVILNKYRS